MGQNNKIHLREQCKPVLLFFFQISLDLFKVDDVDVADGEGAEALKNEFRELKGIVSSFRTVHEKEETDEDMKKTDAVEYDDEEKEADELKKEFKEIKEMLSSFKTGHKKDETDEDMKELKTQVKGLDDMIGNFTRKTRSKREKEESMKEQKVLLENLKLETQKLKELRKGIEEERMELIKEKNNIKEILNGERDEHFRNETNVGQISNHM